MVAALQEYLDKRITPNMKVLSVYTKDEYKNTITCVDVHIELEEVV